MADEQGTAGSLIKTVSPALGAIPYVGPILSMAGNITGGLLEADAAKKQQEQAAKEREAALGMKPAQVNPLFTQKLKADKAAELAGMPAKALWQQMLDARKAADIRAIQESSPSGAATLAAISAAEGNQNTSLNDLMVKDAMWRADMGEKTRGTLWDVGLQANRQEDIRNERQAQQLQAAGALEAAGTFNKQNAINKIIGGVTSTASSLTANAQKQENDAAWMKFLEDYYMKNGELPETTTTTTTTTPSVNVFGVGITPK